MNGMNWKIMEKNAVPGTLPRILAGDLGNIGFKKQFHLKYAYAAGGMYVGIASRQLVQKMARAGMLSFFGSGGLGLESIEQAILFFKENLKKDEPFGINFLSGPQEEALADLLLKHGIRTIEAAAFITMTPALVKYRVKGLEPDENGNAFPRNRVIAKISRPEVARQFLSPPPEKVLEQLLEQGHITRRQAGLARTVPMADHLCVEADSGGHTDQGSPYALLPSIQALRDRLAERFQYRNPICIGAAGGIGTPEAAAAAFILGADFILTGSINQCTAEAGTSDLVKSMLQNIDVQDTDYAPAGDLFETGAKVQVMKKGVFFPARANKLYALYRHCDRLEAMDDKTRRQLEQRIFQKTIAEVYEDVRAFHPPETIRMADQTPKLKMALVFRWYFGLSTRAALEGDESRKVDFQIQCGPALGAFNQWVRGTPLEAWQNRHVDEIGIRLMTETARLLNRRFFDLFGNPPGTDKRN